MMASIGVLMTKSRRVDDAPYVHFITFSCYHRRRLLDHDQPKRILLGVFTEELHKFEARWFEIYSTAKIEEKLNYMHMNPVRAGLVKMPTEWRWSSARWYIEGRTVGIPIQWVD
jgi:hypothetical protein